MVHRRTEQDDFRQPRDQAQQLRRELVRSLDDGRVGNGRMGRTQRVFPDNFRKAGKLPAMETSKIGCMRAAVINERSPSLPNITMARSMVSMGLGVTR